MQIRHADRTIQLNTAPNQISDISDTGACLILAHKPADQQALRLALSTRNHRLTIDARVVHVKTLDNGLFQTGIHFQGLSAEAAGLLHDMVDDYGRGIPISMDLVK
ncbi:MAG: hypothetical protein A2293_14205 [Elusimicrobia bacterium RIFOXYB2_FULL_49_7]|nr:MAG: hypothetical protein A2293_14205 [Elusimicrobia bacterium RIFOXYB2_FULL_49_7]